MMLKFFGIMDGLTDGRTDTMCDNNDHLFGQALVGQYMYFMKLQNLIT